MLTITVRAAHYKGGLINWKPVDPYTNASTVEIIIYESHSWTLSRFPCDQTKIANLGPYTDTSGGGSGAAIACQTSVTSCTGTSFSTFSDRNYCTDFCNIVQISSGALIKKMTLNRNTNIVVGFTGGDWATEILKTSSNTSALRWAVVTRIDLTQKYPINSSPGKFLEKQKTITDINMVRIVSVTGSLPLIRVIEGQTAIIQIPRADWDRTDDIRCRWASSTGAAGDECGDICNNLSGANLSASECTITWDAVRRPYDISRSRTTSTYVVAIMVEDFVNTASTIPMSSVPLQILIFTYQPASGACSTKPEIIGDRPNRACIGVLPGVQHSERIVASVDCAGDYINEFVTISPLYMTKTTIAPVSGTSNQCGAASGNIFCSPESDPIIDPDYWNFNIWDPGVSSTLTTTTTPPTTGTVTTRPISTTIPNPNLTTTGIVITSGTTVQTTTVTTTTTTTETTTTSVTPTTTPTTTTEMEVLSAKDFEEYCKQPVAMTTVATMLVMGVVQFIGMFAFFTKLDKIFNPNRLAAKPNDRLAIITFNSKAHVVQMMKKLTPISIEQLKNHLLEIYANGGTNMNASIECSASLFETISSVTDDDYDNLILFITDIQPNAGCLDEKSFYLRIDPLAKQRIYTTSVGVVTGSLPLIRVIEGQTAIIQIPRADWDRTDDIRCRWASSTGAAGDECGDICNNLSGANLSARSVSLFP
ncbi:unnamed protein product [Rotaria sordida]|uniref:VWFA domain-containing protein n=1 Tax=Rotaria sordida TaxID=392033 RepID=A0A815QBU9_9BILA|nr:unnamed protein product [Rotaria sordida]